MHHVVNKSSVVGCKCLRLQCCLTHRDQLSENIDQNQTEVFEEMGADTDEAVGVNMKQYESLFSGNKRRRT